MITHYRGWVIRPSKNEVEIAFKSFLKNAPIKCKSLEKAKADIDWIEMGKHMRVGK